MGLLSNIRGRLRPSGTQADTSVPESEPDFRVGDLVVPHDGGDKPKYVSFAPYLVKDGWVMLISRYQHYDPDLQVLHNLVYCREYRLTQRSAPKPKARKKGI